MTRSFRNSIPSNTSSARSPKYSARHGYTPRKLKKQGAGKGNWGRIEDEIAAMHDSFDLDQDNQDNQDSKIYYQVYIPDPIIFSYNIATYQHIRNGEFTLTHVINKGENRAIYFLMPSKYLDLDR